MWVAIGPALGIGMRVHVFRRIRRPLVRDSVAGTRLGLIAESYFQRYFDRFKVVIMDRPQASFPPWLGRLASPTDWCAR
jgi:hypothetical protein